MTIQIIAGLGNPGEKYAKTRHNVGAVWVNEIAKQWSLSWKLDAKFEGYYAIYKQGKHAVILYRSARYMNQNGSGVAKIARFFKIPTNHILFAHDELDFPVAKIRLKEGGGHGGHNGLRDCINHLGTSDFLRLRIGIDHPGHAHLVSNYVLKALPINDYLEIEQSLAPYTRDIEGIVDRDVQQSMNLLHV